MQSSAEKFSLHLKVLCPGVIANLINRKATLSDRIPEEALEGQGVWRLSVSFYISECVMSTHLFSISLQFLHDISWKAFRNCFFLTNQNQGSTYILMTAFSCKTLHCLHFFKNSKLSPYMTSSFICSYIQKWAVLNMSVLRSSHLLKYIC